MTYNLNYTFSYDNDDDYRVHLLNSYGIFLETSMSMDHIFSLLSERQNDIYLEINKNEILTKLLNDILYFLKDNIFLSTREELFIYLHNYDTFIYLHNIICCIIANDVSKINDSCNLLKNKIMNNI